MVLLPHKEPVGCVLYVCGGREVGVRTEVCVCARIPCPGGRYGGRSEGCAHSLCGSVNARGGSLAWEGVSMGGCGGCVRACVRASPACGIDTSSVHA